MSFHTKIIFLTIHFNLERPTMKGLFFLIGTFALCLGSQTKLQKFAEFKQKFQKKYSSIDEELKRYEIFSSNLQEIERHNSQQSSFSKGINFFSDLTKDEFKDTYLGTKSIPSSSGLPRFQREFNTSKQLPDSVNWVTEGAVTGVKNQGQCGSCWVGFVE